MRGTSDPKGGNGPAGTPLAPTADPAPIAGPGATAGPAAAGPPAAAATGGGADDRPPADPALPAAVDGGGDTGGANGAAGPPRPALKPREKSDEDAIGPGPPLPDSPLPPRPAGELNPCDGRPAPPSAAGVLAAGVDGILSPPLPKPDEPAEGIDGAPPLPDPRPGMLIGGDNAEGVPALSPRSCCLRPVLISRGAWLPASLMLSPRLELSESVPPFVVPLSSPMSCPRDPAPPLVWSALSGASFGAGASFVAGPRRQPADIPLAPLLDSVAGAGLSCGVLGFPLGLSPMPIDAPCAVIAAVALSDMAVASPRAWATAAYSCG